MPILKSLIPEEPTDDPGESGDDPLVVPNTGFMVEEQNKRGQILDSSFVIVMSVFMTISLSCFIIKTRENC